ncbi:hypothetical protein HYU89_01080 [Candidatus Collierbacteria bacterium]|nr:hypothetical protein [Candidatus Collierbacteria bacterium]
MKNIINLLPESAVEGSRRLSIFKTLQTILIAVAMVCLVLTIGIWSLSLITGREIAVANLKSKDLEEQIAAYSKKEQQFYLLTHQLDKANELLNSRTQIEKKLNTVMTAFPPDANLLSAKIDASGQNISVKFLADNFEKMVKIVTAAKTKPFSLVKVNDFFRNATGQYLIDLTVELL